ncbi:MAG: ABC transporter permease [Elusimicrobiota bacterium]
MSEVYAQFLRGIKTVTEKNMRIYYFKAPVFMFGIMFPIFLFLSFYLGRNVDMSLYFPGLLAMSLFFISSSVGPLITPWEKNAGTYERLLSFPVSINTIIFGNILSGMIFGLILNIAVMAAGLLFIDYSINILSLASGILIGSFTFSSLGVLVASPPATSPSHIMMFSSLVRFPVVFISGIFIPLKDMSGIAEVLSYFSPLTYLVDIFNFSFNDGNHLFLAVDFVMLILFGLIFCYFANKMHKKNMVKGL